MELGDRIPFQKQKPACGDRNFAKFRSTPAGESLEFGLVIQFTESLLTWAIRQINCRSCKVSVETLAIAAGSTFVKTPTINLRTSAHQKSTHLQPFLHLLDAQLGQTVFQFFDGRSFSVFPIHSFLHCFLLKNISSVVGATIKQQETGQLLHLVNKLQFNILKFNICHQPKKTTPPFDTAGPSCSVR